MTVTVLKSKLHRIRVTEACLDYAGSLTIDEDLMDAAGVLNWERLLVANVENGERFETYAIRGPRGSGVCCLKSKPHYLEISAEGVNKGHTLSVLAARLGVGASGAQPEGASERRMKPRETRGVRRTMLPSAFAP